MEAEVKFSLFVPVKIDLQQRLGRRCIVAASENDRRFNGEDVSRSNRPVNGKQPSRFILRSRCIQRHVYYGRRDGNSSKKINTA